MDTFCWVDPEVSQADLPYGDGPRMNRDYARVPAEIYVIERQEMGNCV